MWPWGHLAVGYLWYTLLTQTHSDRSPTGPATLAVVVGTQFPDLIDKPLAWTFDLLASGRSLAHSVAVASTVIALVYTVAARRDRKPLAIAFASGYLSHLAADAILPLVRGEYGALAYFGWPLTQRPPDGGEESVIGQFTSISLTPFFILQLVLVAVAVVVWWHDDAPGLDRVRQWTSRSAQHAE